MSGTVTVVLSGDEKRLLDALDRVVARQAKLRGAAEEAGTASERASNRAVSGFESMEKQLVRVVGRLAPWAIGLQAVNRVVQEIDKSLQAVAERQNKAAEMVRSAAPNFAQLAQLSGGDPAKQRQAAAEARRIYATGAFPSMGSAADAVFNTWSAGFTDKGTMDVISKMALVSREPGRIASAVGTLQKSMGTEKTGDFQTALSKIVKAAELAKGEIGTVAEAASQSGTQAAGMGLSADEVLAGLAVTTLGAAGMGPEEGGTQFSAFLASMSDKKMRGFRGSLADRVEQLAKKGYSQGKLLDLLGRKEAVRGFGTLSKNIGLLREQEAAIRGAPRDLWSQAVEARLADPLVAGAEAMQRQRAQSDLEAEREGRRRELFQAALIQQERVWRAQGHSEEWIQSSSNALRVEEYPQGFMEHVESGVYRTNPFKVFNNLRNPEGITNKLHGQGTRSFDPIFEQAERTPERTEELLKQLVDINDLQADQQRRDSARSQGSGLVDLPPGGDRQGGR